MVNFTVQKRENAKIDFREYNIKSIYDFLHIQQDFYLIK
jgi:hypothetical protein